MSNKILVLGNGFIAQHLPYANCSVRFPYDDRVIIKNIINLYNPNIIINCIAKTGSPNIDWNEHNKSITYLANTTFPSILADICLERKIKFIHIGSGCIFNGKSPHLDSKWTETDLANPASYYSKTKYATDLIIGDLPNVLILRIRMPISEQNLPRNLINKLSSYSKIISEPNSMTFMSDFVRCIDWAIQNDITGILHVTNPEPLSAVQIMTEYQKYIKYDFEEMSLSDLDSITLAKRSNCLLNTDKLTQLGFTMTPSQEALEKCMKAYGENYVK